jgi:CHAD domain-containing protein
MLSYSSQKRSICMEPDYVKLINIKPVLSDYIRESQFLIRKSPVPDAKSVHDIRVLMKKSRAVMRLISSQVDKEFYERQYQAFREVGLRTCSWRDTSVHRKMLKNLKKRYPDLFSDLSDNKELEVLIKKPPAKSEPSPIVFNEIEALYTILSKAGYRVRFENLNNLNPKILINDLEKTYRSVTEIYLECRNNLKLSKMHEFRKRAKDFLYQLYFFRPLNPSTIKSLEKKLDYLTQNLGKYNDFSQLIKNLNYKYRKGAASSGLDEFILIIREEQDKYLSNVWLAARKIFSPGQLLINMLGFRILMI